MARGINETSPDIFSDGGGFERMRHGVEARGGVRRRFQGRAESGFPLHSCVTGACLCLNALLPACHAACDSGTAGSCSWPGWKVLEHIFI